MTARRVILLAALLSLPSIVGAQTPRQPGAWTPVRIAKWSLLGAAAGLAAYALEHSTAAERANDRLRELCTEQPGRCQLDDGVYTDPDAEALFQRVSHEDHLARIGIVGGQVALLGSVGLFVYDLRNGRGPGDIPYPSAASRAAAPRPRVAMGVRLTF
jgi:hypothetical protein